MITKEQVKESIDKMPEPFSIDALIDRMQLLKKVERGLSQSRSGQVIPDDELDDHLQEWLR